MKPKLILRKFLMLAGLGVAALGTVGTMPAQDSNSAATAASQITAVPPLVRYAGNAAHRAGDTVEAVFRIYSAQQGGEPVWSETQRVAIGADGKYSILLGAGTDGGIPAQVFAAGEARWLGVSIERAPEQPRTALVSVAYAMKAADADSVGGLAASELVTRAQLSSVARQMAAQATQLAGPAPQVTPSGAGTANYLPLWTSATTLANSAIYQSGTAASPTLGVFTTKPFVQFDVASISNFRYRLQLYTGQASTPATGVNSPMLQFYASSYLANGARPIQQTFAWQAVAQNNNTSSPSANLELLYSILGQTPTPTGLSIEPSGVINFAPYQTYPGTITSVEPGIGLTGGGTSGNVMLTVDTGLVPLMSSQNSFTALQKFTSGLNVTGVGTVTGALNVNGTASFSSNTAGSTVSVMGGASSAGPVLWVGGGQPMACSEPAPRPRLAMAPARACRALAPPASRGTEFNMAHTQQPAAPRPRAYTPRRQAAWALRRSAAGSAPQSAAWPSTAQAWWSPAAASASMPAQAVPRASAPKASPPANRVLASMPCPTFPARFPLT